MTIDPGPDSCEEPARQVPEPWTDGTVEVPGPPASPVPPVPSLQGLALGQRPYWNTTARRWNRKPDLVVVSLDPMYPEITLRAPPGEMAGLSADETRELINALGEALDALTRRLR